MPRRAKRDESVSSDEVEDHHFESEMEDAPPSIDPYTVLGLETSATEDDVKKAYRKLALKHHPDKALESDKSAANKKFQEIAFAYAILSDERRRKRYDLTGSTAESLEDDKDFDWLTFYREQFEDIVNEANIKRISTEYKNSAQERKDIFTAYKKSRGNLDKIYESVMLSDILEDDERFRKIIDEGIEQGLLESYPIYERDNNDAAREKIKAAERKRRENWDKKHGGVTEATEKAKAKQNSKAKKGGAGGTGGLADLQALIQGRQRARMGGFDSVVDRLEEKYAAKSRSKKRATPMDTEPSEEEFLAAQKKLNMGKKSSRSTKKVAQDYEDEDEAEEDVDLESEEVEEVTPPPKAKRRGRATRTGGRAKTKA